MLIGLTGLIGSGKSEVAKIFHKYGAFVISADKIGKDVVENNKTLLRKLVKEFGPEILSKSGQLNRKILGQLAFASEVKKKKLNNIVHPALLKELAIQTKIASKNNDLVIIDAALLINWGWHKRVDKTILIDTIRRKRVHRLKARGYTESEVKSRSKSQLKLSDLKSQSNIILTNNSTQKSLEKKVENIIAGLLKRG